MKGGRDAGWGSFNARCRDRGIVMSVPTTTTTAEPQQINVADLDLPQLAEVKRQLEEVGAF